MSKEQEKTNVEWLKPEIVSTESERSKLREKMLRNPFVPIGCFATAGALMYGLWAFKSGDSKLSQLMMRYRIAAQALTITAATTGLYLSAQHLEKRDK